MNVANLASFAKFTREYGEIGIIRWKERRFQNQPDLDLVWKREFRTICAGFVFQRIPCDLRSFFSYYKYIYCHLTNTFIVQFGAREFF